MEIIFCRHGQTKAKKEGRLSGSAVDGSLTKEGREQVESLVSQLPENFDVLISSPMKRTIESAEIISKHFNVPIVVERDLIEQNFGSKAGEEIEEIPGFNLKVPVDIAVTLYDFSEYDGESEKQLKSRIKQAIEKIKSNYEGHTVVVVGHAGILRRIYQMTSDNYAEEISLSSVHKVIL